MAPLKGGRRIWFFMDLHGLPWIYMDLLGFGRDFSDSGAWMPGGLWCPVAPCGVASCGALWRPVAPRGGKGCGPYIYHAQSLGLAGWQAGRMVAGWIVGWLDGWMDVVGIAAVM